MKINILLVMLLFPFTAFAATDCRVIEYPDHYEAVCVGDAAQTPASQPAAQYQIPGQVQNAASAQSPVSEQTDVPPEMLVRNELGRMHGASWLKANSGR